MHVSAIYIYPFANDTLLLLDLCLLRISHIPSQKKEKAKETMY